MEITQEWIDQLSDSEYELCERLDGHNDFLVQGDALAFIDQMSDAFGYTKIEVKVNSREDLMGESIVHQSDEGIPYFTKELAWAKQIIENPDQFFCVLFDVNDADDNTVTALKSFVDRHDFNGYRCENVLVGLICKDVNRVFTCKPLIDLVKPVIKWQSE